MISPTIEYLNYNEGLYRKFPKIASCKIYEKNNIINLDINCSNIINDINDDICYDSDGRYILICIGQWHNIETGEYISETDFFDLEEKEVMHYDYVEAVIKIHTKESYRVLYHNFMNHRVKISLIPLSFLDFSSSDSDLILDVKS